MNSTIQPPKTKYIARREDFERAFTSCTQLVVIAIKEDGSVIHTSLAGYIKEVRMITHLLFMVIIDGCKRELEINLI